MKCRDCKYYQKDDDLPERMHCYPDGNCTFLDADISDGWENDHVSGNDDACEDFR